MREKRNLIIVVCCLVCLLQGRAATSENPYQPIIERNVFALKPPPPPVDPEAASKQPPPNIFLQGITTIFGTKRALLKTTPTAGPAKPGAEKPTEQSFILTEGQRDGEVEVVTIDEKALTVTVRLAGKEMTLDFDNNGVKTVAAPAPGQPGAPGMPGALPGMPPTGLIRPTGLTPGAPTPGMPQMPNRSLRLPGTETTSTSTPQPLGAVNTGNYVSGGTLSGLGGPVATSSSPSRGANGELLTISGQPIVSRSRDENMAMAAAAALRREELSKQGLPIPVLKPPWMRQMDGQGRVPVGQQQPGQ